MFYAIFAALALVAVLVPRSVHAQAAKDMMIERGRYIFAVAGGCACHTIPDGTPHVGGRAFPIPFGTVYATNITSDKETGLGSWSDKEILNAMTKGVRPNGEKLLPVMPYEAYSGMAEEDLKAVIAYLRTLKPARKETPRLKSWLPFSRSLIVPLWLKLFGRFSTPPPKAPKGGIERGRYLVDHVSLCGDCHTPRNRLGAPRRARYLAGTAGGLLGEPISNITPDKRTGIGEWSRDDIADLTLTGFKPNLDNVQGLMEEVIEGVSQGYKNMTREDALAIADYLKSAQPISNKIN
ncbi:MAG: c-type cytochrome [Deltaproteobacteria bacterium]|nr:c-type cytochrome [Deltaproteobacteria bacterium]